MQLASFPRESGTTGLRAFLGVLWRRKAVALLMVVLIAAAVAAVLVLTPRQYTAVARMAATPIVSSDQSPANVDDMLGTLASVAESRPVLEDVSARVPSRSLAQLQHEVHGSVVFGTVLVDVTVTDHDPQLAAQIANAVIDRLAAHDPSNGYFAFDPTQPAAVPTGYSSPDVKIVLLAGALLAVALALLAAVVFDRLSRTVATPDEVNEATDAAVLGVVPRPQDASGVPATDPTSTEFGALRTLRVALEFASSTRPTRNLIVAPAVADPGAGWLSVNLAVALAEVGHRVLLIDADRACRRRHPVFDTTEHPGLYDMLAGTVSLDAACLSGPVDGVSVVPLGNVDLAAPSLLEMRFRTLLADIDEKYDVILIHAAPLTESDDARIMATGGGLLLTVPLGRVRPGVLASVMGAVREARIRLIGTVIVGAHQRRR